MAVKKKTNSGRIQRYFVTGLCAVLPLLLTVVVLKWIALTLNGYIGPRTLFGQALQKIGYKFSPISNLTLAYFVGIMLLIVGIFLLGMLLESGAQKTLRAIAQRTVYQLPLVRSIYQTTDKFINLVPSSDDDSMKGMRVVFVKFGNSLVSPGTLALMPSPEVFSISGKEHRIVIIPTAPIPVGGAMLFVPADCVFSTDMNMDDFAGSFVSLGVTTAHFNVGEPIEIPKKVTSQGSGTISDSVTSA